MKFGDRVRVKQNASGHAGDAGVIVEELGSNVVGVAFGQCDHYFGGDELELLPTPAHRYSPQTLSILDMCLTDFREFADVVYPSSIVDFEALAAHVKANLA